MQFLHLNDGEKQPARGHPSFDRLYKVRPFLEKLIRNFKEAYIPSQDLSVDESIIGFKGRLSWIQYLPKKPTKWGIKAWVLADGSNGYTWNWHLYTGKESGADTHKGLAHHVVVSLVEELSHKGYNVFCDNYYTSPALFCDLLQRGFGACGTVRLNRRGLSTEFKTRKLAKGEVYAERISDDSILCLRWKDKRDVSLLSTFHDDTFIEKRRRTRQAADGTEVVKKPNVVEAYNQSMGGVDKADQLVLYYRYAHRSTKWWKRVFFHMLDLTLVNAHILYNTTNSTKQSQLDFRIAVAEGLLQGHTRPTPTHYTAPQVTLPLRLSERAFPEPIPKETPCGGRPQCEVCRARKKKRSQTQFRCKLCHVPLHLHPCFEIYHTKLHYNK